MKPLVILIAEHTGAFAENKELARKLRTETLMPALKKGREVVLDFEGVDMATQSFVHALISDAIRQLGPQALEQMAFKSCSKAVQKIVELVADYMQN